MEAANLMARRGVTKHFPEFGTLAEERGWRRRGEPSLVLRRFLGSLALERSNTWHPPASGCHGFRFTPKEYRGHKEASELKTDAPDNIFGFRHPLDAAIET